MRHKDNTYNVVPYAAACLRLMKQQVSILRITLREISTPDDYTTGQLVCELTVATQELQAGETAGTT